MLRGCPPAARSARTAVGSKKARQRPFHHPAVPTQPFARIDPAPGYARLYATLPKDASAAREVVALVDMDLVRLPSGPSARGPYRLDALYELLEDPGVVDVGPGQDHRERQAVAVDQEVALGAGATSVYGVGTGLLAPFFAGTLAESN